MQKQFKKIVLGTLFLTAGIASCTSISVADSLPKITRSPAASPVTVAQNSGSFSALEQSTHAQINQYRKSRNLPPLTLNAQISQQARLHSQAMASGKVPFSHDGFQQRVQVIRKSISYRGAAENVAYNQGFNDPDKQAVEGWLKSPGHYKNIVGQYDLTGIGVAKNAKGEYYFTQIFIKRG